MLRRELTIQANGGDLSFLDAAAEWHPQPSLRNAIRGPARCGLLLIAAFVLVLVVWGFLVPLAGGAMAPGVVTPNQGIKTVQHLEGGIIGALRVHNGDIVKAGQPLVVIDDVQARAEHDALQQQLWSLLAKQARLSAESEQASQIEWPRQLQSSDPHVRAVVDAQQKVFETRRKELATRESVLTKRIAQLRDQITGIQMEVKSSTTQLSLVDQELRAKKKLLKQGLVVKPVYLRLKRVKAQIEGQRGEYLAQIAQAQQQVGEAKLKILESKTERATRIAKTADKTRINLEDTIEKLRSNNDVIKRTVIRAPISGTIINCNFKTIGGVVRAGQPILQIVPANDSLVIDARVSPLDLKSVHKDLKAEVRFPEYSDLTTSRILGTVESISAGRLRDKYTHRPYYSARIDVNRKVLRRIAPKVKLVPGMPVDVLIIAHHHTMFQYLFKPFLQVLRRSFHEV